MPGGLLLISVPDMQTLAKMYLDKSFSFQDHFMVTKMFYGAQSDMFDYHFVGFDEDLLTYFLHQAGFCEIERVGNFNLFQDTSTMVFNGYTVSLNMAAKACPIRGMTSVEIDHSADPYVRE